MKSYLKILYDYKIFIEVFELSRKDSIMKLTISAQDKPAQKVFDYQLDLDPDTILKMTALICGTVAAVSLLSLFKEK
ncbi:hypothetical protein DYJ42_07840 [Streptococcus constellatus]|nr:hypothetical protein HMPREF2963_01695 [Streptococcus sp. HMSC067A03]RID96506.1 hypothetical protein DYJ42_07840 [Streptococcus constellatus]GAD38277.1 hypothetical protein ANG2_0605 [Streptococcus constellatus subsp. constellatus SK53]